MRPGQDAPGQAMKFRQKFPHWMILVGPDRDTLRPGTAVDMARLRWLLILPASLPDLALCPDRVLTRQLLRYTEIQ